MPGMTITSPGPRVPARRPSRKITRRSYSCTTLTPLAAITSSRITTMPTDGTAIAPPFSKPSRGAHGSHAQPQTRHLEHLDPSTDADRRFALGLPVLPPHAHHTDRCQRLGDG